ncbi:hypothetical protein [Burkholderia metallica]|uniref:hypothetical protein n=1 Tax=Burkholderia metallica TaxID=488729 RepID=UPI001575F5AF|nr:hypothetical protein [Burkholderia metallica]NTZ06311.1 hypothetical protein [Burkholderia metallica]
MSSLTKQSENGIIDSAHTKNRSEGWHFIDGQTVEKYAPIKHNSGFIKHPQFTTLIFMEITAKLIERAAAPLNY